MTIGAAQQFFLGASKATGGGAAGYQIERSLRFNSNDSGFCSRTPSVAGNRKTFTLSWWMKRSGLTTFQVLFNSYTDVSNRTAINFDSSVGAGTAGDYLTLFNVVGGVTTSIFQTNALFRDSSAWYHVVVSVDTTQAVSTDRVRLWVNNALQTFSVYNAPTQNSDLNWNSATAHYFGVYGGSPGTTSYGFNGYLAECYLIDGQALTPSSFTEVSATTGQLIPKQYTGSFGTNGFWLKFSDNSAATATTLGKDYSGNSNNWTLNNISVGFPVTQNYSTTTTGTAPTPYQSTNYYALAFDGDTSTSFSWTTGTWAMDWTSLPSAVTVSSSLRIFCYPRLGTLTVNINGSNVASITGNSVDWRVISFTGTISTISFTGTDTYAGVYAIEVNGAILIDPRANKANDSLVDTPTSYGTDTYVGGEVRGNYATFNPIGLGGGTLSNGNLDLSTSTPTAAVGTFAMKTGKWYWEITCNTVANPRIGVFNIGASSPTGLGNDANGWCLLNSPSRTFNNSSALSYGTFSPVSGTIVNVAYDADAGKLWFGQDGSYFASGNPATGANPSMSSVTGSAIVPALSSGGTDTYSANFGQRAFAYTAPSGFKALCDTNLPAPVVAKPNTVMDVKLYTGNGTGQAITGLAFSPDFIWTKSRSRVDNHGLHDIVRGRASNLYSDLTNPENISSAGADLVSFDANGYTLGTVEQTAMNRSGETYVAWTWDAGTSTVTNTQGSITSQVRANASAGFSVVTFTSPTGTGNFSAGHGLGVTPEFVIVKSRDAAGVWYVYHKSLATDHYLRLNGTNASATDGVQWGAGMTSSVLGLRASYSTVSGATTVAYAWTPVVGYSSFGSYTGNGSTDGPFVYTGFRPRWVMVKRTDAARDWFIYDAARNTYNIVNNFLRPNLSDAEGTGTLYPFDFLSNGFKLRSSETDINGSGGTWIYAAFAENPFQYARAR